MFSSLKFCRDHDINSEECHNRPTSWSQDFTLIINNVFY